jgi:hypothetical protein
VRRKLKFRLGIKLRRFYARYKYSAKQLRNSNHWPSFQRRMAFGLIKTPSRTLRRNVRSQYHGTITGTCRGDTRRFPQNVRVASRTYAHAVTFACLDSYNRPASVLRSNIGFRLLRCRTDRPAADPSEISRSPRDIICSTN